MYVCMYVCMCMITRYGLHYFVEERVFQDIIELLLQFKKKGKESSNELDFNG